MTQLVDVNPRNLILSGSTIVTINPTVFGSDVSETFKTVEIMIDDNAHEIEVGRIESSRKGLGYCMIPQCVRASE